MGGRPVARGLEQHFQKRNRHQDRDAPARLPLRARLGRAAGARGTRRGGLGGFRNRARLAAGGARRRDSLLRQRKPALAAWESALDSQVFGQKKRANRPRDPAQPRDIPLERGDARRQPHFGDGRYENRSGRAPSRNLFGVPDPRFGRNRRASGHRLGALLRPERSRRHRRLPLANPRHSANPRPPAKPNPQPARASRNPRDDKTNPRNPRQPRKGRRAQVLRNRRFDSQIFFFPRSPTTFPRKCRTAA